MSVRNLRVRNRRSGVGMPQWAVRAVNSHSGGSARRVPHLQPLPIGRACQTFSQPDGNNVAVRVNIKHSVYNALLMLCYCDVRGRSNARDGGFYVLLTVGFVNYLQCVYSSVVGLLFFAVFLYWPVCQSRQFLYHAFLASASNPRLPSSPSRNAPCSRA